MSVSIAGGRMEESGRVAVITGASSGIGAALARRLGSEGFRLVIAARREAELRQVCADSGTECRAVTTDVTRRGDVERLRDAALESFGHVDIWVNNVGRGINASVLDLTDEQFDLMMAVNVKSALYGMQAVIPYFKTRGTGHLINVSTFLSRVPLASYRSAYNAAKAALNALTANARMDLRREYPGIHVSLVIPGMVTTDFPRNALGGTPAVTWMSADARRTGAPRVQTADEVAEAIADLIAHPRAEIYTQPAQVETMRRYYDNVDAFELGTG